MASNNFNFNYIKNALPAEPRNDDINIMLLGETGVGKSTFINSFANYMHYFTLEEAQASEVFCIIPTKFTIPDENLEMKLIHFGNDENEDTVLGHSSTQEPRSYVFPMGYENRNIRLIDTPGIGDSRGLKQDEVNFEKILDYISRFDVIHAICFLLKPNVSVITPYFKFCIKHLLSRLDKTARNNIVFLFTNSRSTFYRPAETLVILRRILKDIETGPTKVIIPCDIKNIFCMDNEAFKFLIALKNNYTFGEKDFEAFSASWNKSVEACQQLLAYVVGDHNNVGLVPHSIQNTISINEARRVILDLSKPMADISQMVHDNLIVLDRHKIEIAENTTTIEELGKKMYIPAIDIVEINLPGPVTVCTSNQCSEKYTIDGITKYHYKQRCHNPCYLKNVPTKIIGSPELLSCAAMGGRTKCRQCGCDYQTHMHIQYETELKSVKISDDTVKIKIKNKEDIVKAKEDMIATLNKRRTMFETEKKTITKYTAQFAHFLTRNSITPYNDAYGDYLYDLIQNEKTLGDSGNSGLIKTYQEMLQQYNEEKQILDDAMKLSGTCTVKLDDVFKMEEDLYKLPICGTKLKSLHETQKKGRMYEFKTTAETVYTNKSLINRLWTTAMDTLLGNSREVSTPAVSYHSSEQNWQKSGKKQNKKGKSGKNNQKTQSPPIPFDNSVTALAEILRKMPPIEAAVSQQFISNYIMKKKIEILNRPTQSGASSSYLAKTNKTSYKMKNNPDEFDLFATTMADQLNMIPMSESLIIQEYIIKYLTQKQSEIERNVRIDAKINIPE